MKFRIADDARPQLKTLLFATVLSIVLWFIPFTEYLVYPFKLFVTFIHESCHVLAALLTQSAVYSLTVAPDTSGAVLAAPQNLVAALIVSSAGYVGASAFGALMLILIRRNANAKFILAGFGIFIAFMTTVFGLLLPIWNVSRAETTVFGVTFTVASGYLIAASLLLLSRYASSKVAGFFVSFLAVQCVLNALFDLKTLFFLSSPFANQVQSDATNMYNATGFPPIVWVMVWISLSIFLFAVALRVYAVSRQKDAIQPDLPFED